MTYDKTHFNIRPSQIIGSFGPGSIYDNQLDSIIIMGLDKWKPEKFKVERDEILLQEIKKNSSNIIFSSSDYFDLGKARSSKLGGGIFIGNVADQHYEKKLDGQYRQIVKVKKNTTDLFLVKMLYLEKEVSRCLPTKQ